MMPYTRIIKDVIIEEVMELPLDEGPEDFKLGQISFRNKIIQILKENE